MVANSEFYLEKTKFTEYMVTYNRLDETGFREWFFYPGMAFNSPEKWWGNGGYRHSPHEGTDICFYKNRNNKRLRLDKTAKIPAMYDGEVVRIGDDFLGKSVYMRHEICDGRGRQLYTIYGHTTPCHHLHSGSVVKEGEVIATISDHKKKVKILPHLHISVAWVPVSYPCEKLDWSTISNTDVITLVNPMEVIAAHLSPHEKSKKQAAIYQYP
ncbi:M23 family metallopeptidase [Desulfonema magnum]|uniref:Peptidase M23 domain-containing protein n=1 Tax=Desulfonema magnum TaxID=45655 RepID=A0A975BN20_9BACT|nr:peptidoglycan DD-metalloendopeptidase family protein [Desulfonema magnum]QTA88460.1 Peptidase M23 domain-containing protein [Desulfonema magnum]